MRKGFAYFVLTESPWGNHWQWTMRSSDMTGLCSYLTGEPDGP